MILFAIESDVVREIYKEIDYDAWYLNEGNILYRVFIVQWYDDFHVRGTDYI